jgi:hypothetical protein
VLSVQPSGNDGGDEELRAVGVGAGVGHGKETRLGVLQLEVLVLELLAVNGLAAGTVTAGEVTSLSEVLVCDLYIDAIDVLENADLEHELGNHTRRDVRR